MPLARLESTGLPYVADQWGASVTQLFDKAVAEVAKLPEPEQDALAAILLEEIAFERRWSEAFAGSQEALARLAEEALAEHASGRTASL